VLQCCPNGARPIGAYPAVPVSPRHLARDARAVSALGVVSVHVHPRDTDGRESLAPGTVGAVTSAVRDAATSGSVTVTSATTRTVLRGRPACLSCTASPEVHTPSSTPMSPARLARGGGQQR
jgi:uncharacterized protein (DUF849 family)